MRTSRLAALAGLTSGAATAVLAFGALAEGAASREPSAGSADGRDALRVARKLASAGPRPAASVAERSAQAFVAGAFQSAGLRVAAQGFAVPGNGRSRNIIGALDTPATCLKIVMAHIDSAPGAPGANDNASGVGVVVAVARRLRALQPDCDVWLAANGAEERLYTDSPDHLGALALARRAQARGGADRLRFALSLDEVGRDRPFWLRSPVAAPRAGVERALLRAGRDAGTPVTWVRDDDTGNSDHREFELLGLPAAKLGVGGGGEPCRHTPCDTADRLDRRSLAQAQRLVERALAP